MKEERDGEEKDRSWWTAVGLFTSRISLLSRCLAAHRGKGRERDRERGAGAKDVSDWRFGGGCQVGLIMVYFMTCTFKVLRGQQPGISGRNALSQNNTGNTRLTVRTISTDPDESPRGVKEIN